MSDWQRVQSIFLAAADLPAAERSHVLDELCDGDVELRMDVETLLAADDDSAITIDSAIQGVASNFVDNPLLIGERVGVYRIVREIGRGGMGSVYLALRDDEEYTKEVALKVVKQGMNTAEVLRRFRDERQILANLDHPYIARLLDGGTTTKGIPFFAMEYVEGRPVDVFCRENSLDIKARCRLFLHILEAIAYAHRNLVVHGDLKPANIFVTPEGTPKLLDFGVAKLTGREPGAAEVSTKESRIFTPGYASPEQVRGETVTTSTDIYSLGAVLYELVSGHRAQPVDIGPPDHIEHAICNVEVMRPELVARGLPADLNDVILMALRKEPERRYQSATQFADDICHCLEDRPVIAREDSFGYRIRKFVVRNRLEVAMATVVTTALIAGLVISLAQTRRARAERATADSERQIALSERAEAEAARASEAKQQTLADEQRGLAELQRGLAENERDEAERAKALADQRLKDILQLADRTLFDVHDAIAPLPGSLPARRKIAETTLDYLKTMENNVGTNDEMREALTAAYFKVSLIQGNPHGASLQDSASAEQSLLKAQALLLPAYHRHPNDAGLMMRLIEVRSSLSDLIYRSGRTQEAIQIYVDLLPVAHRLSLIKSCIALNCETQESVMENSLAVELLPLDPPRSLEHADRSAELSRELVVRHPSDASLKQALAVVTAVVAAAYKNLGNLEKAGDFYRQSIEVREDLLRDDPGNSIIRRNILVACGNYATLLGIPWSQNLGRPDEARKYAAKSVAIARELVSADPNDATARRDLGMSLGRLGMIDPVPGETATSLAYLQEANSLMAPIVAANPKSADIAEQLGEIEGSQAHRLAELGRPTEAVQMFRKSMALLEPFADLPKSTVTTEYLSEEESLALLYASMGNVDEALSLANRAVAVEQKRTASSPPSETHAGQLAAAWSTLALTQSKAGLQDRAKQSGEKAMQLWGSIQNPGILTAFRRQMSDTRTLLAVAQ
jgi:serine/threonine protein kinase/tetratricopeptide (TPR) repeat protein